MSLTISTVPVGDIDIACTVVGDGTPVIVLHGAVGLGSTYMRALDPWGDELRLVHYDQRGSGETPIGDPEKVTFSGALEDLDGLRLALGFEKVQLLGHSAGAYLAALYAATHPDASSGLVMLNSGPPLDPQLMQRFGEAMTARRTPADRAERRAIEESPEFMAHQPAALERHQLNTFAPFFRDRATIEHVTLGFTEITAANVQVAPQRMIGSLGPLDPMGRFAGIGCPTLVVHSEKDPIPIEWSRMLADTIPGAEFALIENGNHFPMVEDAAQLRGVVVPWLTSHAPV